MPTSPTSFVWYDLMTADAKAAEAFYRDVVGWRAQDAGMPDRSYTILSAGETPIGGLMGIPPEARAAGARPVWNGYVAVADVDAVAARVKQEGGAIHHAPEDIPGVGRFACVADPQGAMFMLFKGSTDEQPQPTAPGTPGHIGWRELLAGDGKSAFAFYSGLFGWTKAEAIDIGAMGVYQLFAAGGAPIGGMMTKPDAVPAPSWLYYFNVKEIQAAAARVTGKGGQVVHGPMEVPGGAWIVQCVDPQGAAFALVAPPA
ncbi:MAG: VOC family protein [Acetobacteraceae bacterium]